VERQLSRQPAVQFYEAKNDSNFIAADPDVSSHEKPSKNGIACQNSILLEDSS
jgi:hypothetical protein